MGRTIRQIVLGLMVASGFGLAGCASTASFVTGIATELSQSTPRQVTTLAEAVSAATLVTGIADLAVNTGRLDRPTLIEVQALNEGLHAALRDLEDANSAGKSLDYAAFNAALAAWNAYATSKGIGE